MNVFVLLLALSTGDTTRCTWEGRIHDRGEAVQYVSRPAELARLVSVLRSGSKHERQLVARAIGELMDNRAVDPLIDAMDDPNKHVASEVVWSLGRLRDGRLESVLLQALADPDEHVQQAAACGLGRVGTQRALGALERKRRSTANVYVSSAADWAIGRITGPAPPTRAR